MLERRVEDILESIDELSTVDRQWRYTYINERTLHRIQRAKGEELTREELLGKDIGSCTPSSLIAHSTRSFTARSASSRPPISKHTPRLATGGWRYTPILWRKG
jgi:hypothetical protein